MSAFLRTASRAIARPASTAARTFSSTASRPIARITIIGNLGDTPELRTSPSGQEYVRYAVASNTGSTAHRKTSWFNVTYFPKAEGRRDFILSLPKGSMVMVEGDATVSNHLDSEGKQRQSLSVVQRNFNFLRKPSNASAVEHEDEHEH